jgi:hypothetical protein
VSETEIDRAVHDYLDGRLSEEERRAFEARLERDPELARTVEDYRAAGRSLRGVPVELPPRFYARTRARFEASRPARPAWRRFVSWEATGLAAAALLLTALVLPEVRKWYGPPRGVTPFESPSAPSPEAPPEAKLVSPAEATDSIASPVEGEASGLEPPSDKREVAAETEAFADHDSGLAERDEVTEPRSAAPPKPDLEKSRAGKGSSVGAPRRDQAVEENFARQKTQAAPQREAEPDRYRTQQSESLHESDFAPAPSLGDKAATPPRVEALPPGAVVARELIVIDDPESWTRFLQDLPVDSSLALRPDFATERVAVVGPAPGLSDCNSVRWAEIDDRIVIEWPPTALRGTGASGGCIVAIPADGRPVEIGN